MKFDADEIVFHGLAHRIAEKEISASLTEDRDKRFLSHLWLDYSEAGKPTPAEAWLRDRLRAAFVSAVEPPRWIEQRPIWPFFDGRPMSFVTQVEAPKFLMADGRISSASTLYIFEASSPEPVSGGWSAVFRIVQQFPGL